MDDNSPDGTAKIAEQLQKVYPNKIVHRPFQFIYSIKIHIISIFTVDQANWVWDLLTLMA